MTLKSLREHVREDLKFFFPSTAEVERGGQSTKKWPDKSTTSYALLYFESDKENLAIERI